jgi:hypothetical protein
MAYIVRCWDCRREEKRLYEHRCSQCGRPGGDITRTARLNEPWSPGYAGPGFASPTQRVVD